MMHFWAGARSPRCRVHKRCLRKKPVKVADHEIAETSDRREAGARPVEVSDGWVEVVDSRELGDVCRLRSEGDRPRNECVLDTAYGVRPVGGRAVVGRRQIVLAAHAQHRPILLPAGLGSIKDPLMDIRLGDTARGSRSSSERQDQSAGVGIDVAQVHRHGFGPSGDGDRDRRRLSSSTEQSDCWTDRHLEKCARDRRGRPGGRGRPSPRN